MNGLADIITAHRKILGREETWQELSDYITMTQQLAIKRSSG